MIQRHVNGNMIDLDFTIDGDTLPELQLIRRLIADGILLVLCEQ